MGADDVQAVLRSFAAWNEGGVEAARATWADDAEWHDPPGFPDAGVHRGMDAVGTRLEELRDLLPHQVEVVDAIPAADGVVILLTFHGEGEGSGAPIEQQMGCICEVREGKVRSWRPFLSHAEALAAAGLA